MKKLLRDDRILLALYAVVVASAAFVLRHDALMTQDGDVLFDMTRSFWQRGTLEVPNGLYVSDTLDLVIKQTAKLGSHTFGKYPPLYAVIAAMPVGLLGIRGMYLLNAIALAALVITFRAFARRVLAPRTALLAALALPFVVPLFPYALMELPHMVSAALVLAAVFAFVLAARRSDQRVAFALALAAGLLAGVAIGIRLQNVTVAAVLVALGFLRARRRWVVSAGQVAGQLACVVAIALLNRPRFGVANPFSYGTTPLAPNAATENASYFVSRLEVLLGMMYPFSLAIALRRARSASTAERVVSFGALAGFLAWAPLRHQLARMFAAACVVLVNTTSFVDEPPSTTFGWLNKSLLWSSPLLALGLVGVGRCIVKRAPLALETVAWVCFVMIVFISTREPDPATEASTTGFFSISPRYLVDLFAPLLLLATWMLRRAKLGAAFAIPAAIVGLPMFVLFLRTDNDGDPRRAFVVLTGSLVLAVLVGVAFAVTRARTKWGPRFLAASVGVCVAYSCVVTTLGDADALLQMSVCDEKWSRAIIAATPPRIALVGWDNAKDPVYAVRERRDAVFVNAAVDDPAQLRATLRALEADGRPIYFFGLGIEQTRPMVEPEFHVIPLLQEPLLWRFDSH